MIFSASRDGATITYELTGDDGPRGFGHPQLAAEGDNAAERGGRPGFIGDASRIEVSLPPHAARVGVLDDYAGWLVELFSHTQRRVGISDIARKVLCPEPAVRWQRTLFSSSI